ncbi:hypothetical protein OS493_018999 [Desmophyllum pertusum]|uniref:Uncharacterized protein n=1 Tax=Desmophyllum pertusum TaxID=174260 RepID=A0A9X0CQN7_9CNID|nr:hypothetical protein OS493_018999 [Desmophyllum pertusum]
MSLRFQPILPKPIGPPCTEPCPSVQDESVTCTTNMDEPPNICEENRASTMEIQKNTGLQNSEPCPFVQDESVTCMDEPPKICNENRASSIEILKKAGLQNSELSKHANTPLQMEEILKLWHALETKIPTEIAKAIMVLPSVKSCMKYLFLEEIDDQCRDLCVRKHGKHGPSILHVSRQDTKSSLENFTWASIIEEMKERAPDLLDVIATVSVPVVKEKENQVPQCVLHMQ